MSVHKIEDMLQRSWEMYRFERTIIISFSTKSISFQWNSSQWAKLGIMFGEYQYFYHRFVWSKDDCKALLFSSSPFHPLSCRWFFNLSFLHRLASWLELCSQVGWTTDHFSSCCIIQLTEDLSTMRVQLAGATPNRGLMNWVLQIGPARIFYPCPRSLLYFGYETEIERIRWCDFCH